MGHTQAALYGKKQGIRFFDDGGKKRGTSKNNEVGQNRGHAGLRQCGKKRGIRQIDDDGKKRGTFKNEEVGKNRGYTYGKKQGIS